MQLLKIPLREVLYELLEFLVASTELPNIHVHKVGAITSCDLQADTGPSHAFCF